MGEAVALTGDDANRAAGARASGRGIVLAGDRSRQFRQARRHSALIRVLRLSLPLATVGLVGLYVYTMLRTAGYGVAAPPPSIVATLDKEIAMDNPKYEGFTKDGGSYVVTAKTAIPDLKSPSLVRLNVITGESFDARKSRTELAAARGLFDTKANQLELMDGITVVTQSGMRATLQTATMMTKEGTLTSRTPVKVEMPSGTVTSNELDLNQKTKDVTFRTNVVAHLIAAAKPEASPTAAVATPAPAAVFGSSRAPVDVTADRLDVHDGKKTAQFSGSVKAVQGVASLETAVLDISYDGDAQTAGGAPVAAAPGDPAAAPQAKIKRIVAPRPVVLTQGTGDRVTGNSADFDAPGEIAVVAGNVVMTSGVDRRAIAERAEFAQKPDTILLTGNVIVTQARNELRGRRLFVDRKAGRTELTSPAEAGLARSRIFAKLYQGDGQPAKAVDPKKAAAAAAVAAAGPVGAALGFATFKTDPNAPVDVEADKMTVEDAKKVAVFTGDVKAAQGDFTVRTIELSAFYSGDGGLSAVATVPAAAATGAADAPKAPAQLTRIEAKGKVVVTSKAAQQVTGDWAKFDMKANTVTVGGRDVILTQDKNISSCVQLEIDMTSGLSKCVTPQGGVTVQGGTDASGKPKRPSLVFYPQERKKDGADGAKVPAVPAPPPKPAASSWESAVEPNRPN
jgi:hypothetical protein